MAKKAAKKKAPAKKSVLKKSTIPQSIKGIEKDLWDLELKLSDAEEGIRTEVREVASRLDTLTEIVADLAKQVLDMQERAAKTDPPVGPPADEIEVRGDR